MFRRKPNAPRPQIGDLRARVTGDSLNGFMWVLQHYNATSYGTFEWVPIQRQTEPVFKTAHECENVARFILAAARSAYAEVRRTTVNKVIT